MTHLSQRRIFQSGDFRLTDSRTGQVIDYRAQKQIIVQRFGWTALVGFCGIAHTGREYVPEWIVQQLRATPQDTTFEDFLRRLQSAEVWLAGADPRFRAITFSIGAFVDFHPTFVLISNFESIVRPPRALPGTFPATLGVTRFKPNKERLFLSGRRDAVPVEDRQWLLGTFRKVPPHEGGYAEHTVVLPDLRTNSRWQNPSSAHTAGDLMSEAQALLRRSGIAVETEDRIGEPAEQILSASKEHAADLIAVGRGEHRPLESLVRRDPRRFWRLGGRP